MLNIQPNKQGQARQEPPISTGNRFGEFDDSGTGTDLTLEWDSNDPDLHTHLAEAGPVDEFAKSGSDNDEDYYRYFKEAGLPDA